LSGLAGCFAWQYNLALLFVTSHYITAWHNALNGVCLACTFAAAIWRIAMNTSLRQCCIYIQRAEQNVSTYNMQKLQIIGSILGKQNNQAYVLFRFDLRSQKIILRLLLNQNIDLVQDIVPGIGETYYNLMKIFESMQDTIPSVALLSYIRTLIVCHLI